MNEWARLTPAERGEMRLRYQESQQVPAPDRSAKWQEYQNLPPDAKQQLAARAAASAAPAKADPLPGAKAGSGTREGSQAKANVVPNPTLAQRPTPVAPTMVQAAPGATTRFITRPATPPEHQQSGMPKITATPEFVNGSTLLPQPRAAGRGRGPGAVDAAPAPPGRPASQAAGRAEAGSMTPDSGAAAPRAAAASTPSLLRRMACFVYEATLMFGIALVPALLGTLFFAQTGQSHPLQSEGVVRAFALVVYGIYFVGCWSVRGQTLAMQTWRIRVVTAEGARLSQARALARYVACCIAWFGPATLVAAALHLRPWPTLGAVVLGIVVYALLALAAPGRPVLARHRLRHAAGRHARRAGAGPELDRVLVDLAGANPDHALDRGDEDLAVADLAGLGGLDDRLDAALGVAVLHHDLDLHLGQEVDHVLGAAVELGVALLPAEALDLGDGQAGDPDLGQRLAHLLQLERLDDGGDLFHDPGSGCA